MKVLILDHEGAAKMLAEHIGKKEEVTIRNIGIWKILQKHGPQIWMLCGDGNKELRRQIMEELTGERLPLSKCGINALTEKLRDLIGVSNTEGCEAWRENRTADRINDIIRSYEEGEERNRTRSETPEARGEPEPVDQMELF